MFLTYCVDDDVLGGVVDETCYKLCVDLHVLRPRE